MDSVLRQPLTEERQKPVDVFDVLSIASLTESVRRLPQIPCARSTLLFGMASGASIGIVQLLGGRKMNHALNWTVGTFIFISIFGWETCRRSRAQEQMQMKSIMEAHEKRRKQTTEPVKAPVPVHSAAMKTRLV